jgi:pyruvate dehydrogenase E2 component (dihydrolipoamide acetyltransferase)
MATTVIIPKLGQEMTEGKVVTWLKREGDQVRKGEPIFELETDKATVEVESPAAGVVARILVDVDTLYPVGTAAVIVADPGEDIARLQADTPSSGDP